MTADPVFREVQRVRQWWVWALLGVVGLFVLVAGPAAWPGLLVVATVAVFVYSLSLRTEVRADGVYVQLWPLHWSARRVGWEDLERYEAVTYSPLREFGGWGIRWVPGRLAYSISGNRGVWLHQRKGRSILVGSRRAEEFVDAIDDVYVE